MHPSDLAQRIHTASFLNGQFVLRSGQTSSTYVDKYRFESDPQLLRDIARALAALLPPEVEVLAGLELGGIPLATAVSLETGLPVIFVRKEAKTYGTRNIAEGGEFEGKRICLVEDVITTGGQVIKSATALRQEGGHVDWVLHVISRHSDANRNLEAAGLESLPLLTLEEIIGLRQE